jgi:hypothetical protein
VTGLRRQGRRPCREVEGQNCCHFSNYISQTQSY